MAETELPERVLVVTAHPDDVDFGAAGTVATLTDAGVPVSYCIVTNGDAGALDTDTDTGTLATRRQQEQRDAAAAVGVSDVHCLGFPDGQLLVTLDLRREITRVIRMVMPQRVICQSPERNWDRIRASHPDHLAAGEATLSAVYPDSRNPFAFPELFADGLRAHTVSEVWLMASPRASRTVDITKVIDRKIGALRCHKSQVGDGDHIEELVRNWTSATAREHGLGEGRYAEVFQVVDTH